MIIMTTTTTTTRFHSLSLQIRNGGLLLLVLLVVAPLTKIQRCHGFYQRVPTRSNNIHKTRHNTIINPSSSSLSLWMSENSYQQFRKYNNFKGRTSYATSTLFRLQAQRKNDPSSSSRISSNSRSSSSTSTKTTATTTTSLLQSVEGDYNTDLIQRNIQQRNTIQGRLKALYKFSRPHTIRGTILASIAGTIRAMLDTPNIVYALQHQINYSILLPQALIGVLALLLGNAFIVGINQIYDYDIDKVNKPFLPIASGEMSNQFAWITILLSAGIGPTLVYRFFPIILFQLYSIGMLLGFLYSVPPFRTKRNPILAALTIACVRGLFLNFGVYYGVTNALQQQIFTWSPKVFFIARFMTLYATVIAITKDLPDVEGDKAYQIETFATKLGVEKMAKGSTLFLLGNYIHALVTGLFVYPKGTFRMLPMIGGHTALAIGLIYRYKQLMKSKTTITTTTGISEESTTGAATTTTTTTLPMSAIKLYYKHIWDFFYLEYVLYTLI